MTDSPLMPEISLFDNGSIKRVVVMVAAEWDPKANSTKSLLFSEDEVLEMLQAGTEPVVWIRGGGSDDDDDGSSSSSENQEEKEDDLEAEVTEVLEGNLDPKVKKAHRSRQFEFVVFLHGECVKAQREEAGLTQSAISERNLTCHASHFENVFNSGFLEEIEDIIGADMTLEEAEEAGASSNNNNEHGSSSSADGEGGSQNPRNELKELFDHWITDASRSMHEGDN